MTHLSFESHQVSQDHSKMKVMLEAIFNLLGITCLMFMPWDATVSIERYKKVFTWLQNAICMKYPELWATEDWVLLRDSIRANRPLLVQQKVTKRSYDTVVFSLIQHTLLISHCAICIIFHE
jgi:hypothetical protein